MTSCVSQPTRRPPGNVASTCALDVVRAFGKVEPEPAVRERERCRPWSSDVESDHVRECAVRPLGRRAPGKPGGLGGAQPELRRDRLERLDHVADVVVQLEPEQLRAGVDLVAVDAGRERRLLELLLHGLRLEAVDARRPHEPARVDEPGELVAGEERLLERRVARHLQVLGVREDALDDDLRVALLAQDRRAVLRMLVERGVDLVVEVVQERGDAPQLLVLAEVARVPARRRLDRRAHAAAAPRSSCSGSACPRPARGSGSAHER